MKGCILQTMLQHGALTWLGGKSGATAWCSSNHSNGSGEAGSMRGASGFGRTALLALLLAMLMTLAWTESEPCVANSLAD